MSNTSSQRRVIASATNSNTNANKKYDYDNTSKDKIKSVNNRSIAKPSNKAAKSDSKSSIKYSPFEGLQGKSIGIASPSYDVGKKNQTNDNYENFNYSKSKYNIPERNNFFNSKENQNFSENIYDNNFSLMKEEDESNKDKDTSASASASASMLRKSKSKNNNDQTEAIQFPKSQLSDLSTVENFLSFAENKPLTSSVESDKKSLNLSVSSPKPSPHRSTNKNPKPSPMRISSSLELNDDNNDLSEIDKRILALQSFLENARSGIYTDQI